MISWLEWIVLRLPVRMQRWFGWVDPGVVVTEIETDISPVYPVTVTAYTKGPVPKPILIESMADFKKHFGEVE